MFSFLKKEKEAQEVVETALNEMKKIYKKNLLPLEVKTLKPNFHQIAGFLT
jgi:hypothetical protein